MTDESILSFGMHKGKRLIDVPASYLLWLFDENKCSAELCAYIADNIDVLKKEAKR